MTQTEIEALAREYAEYNSQDMLQFFQPPPYPDSVEVLLKEKQRQAVDTFKWLSDRYEIVSKERIKAEHSKAMIWSDNARSYIEGRANMSLLESLFPQTLKSEEK